MRLLSLRRYASGYLGLLEEEAGYLYFSISRRGRLRRLLLWERSTYQDLRHVRFVLGRFMPTSAFLRQPLPMSELCLAECDRLWRCIASDDPGSV
jgi:hypothetical protein